MKNQLSPKELAQQKISTLVERFREQEDYYARGSYNETQTRRDYIDPFFKALGWDMDNEQGAPEAYRDVVHEDKQKVGGATKAPDYGFTIHGNKKFYVEAKKPSVDVKEDIHPAYQVRRYGWSAKLPISIVTDFQEFAVYDCTVKPSSKDKASIARTQYLNFKDYLNEFDFLWDTFSKESVQKGSLDRFAKAEKKGTSSVDKEFLKSIEEWRKQLAKNIAVNNKKFSEDDINYTVQQTLDRIIFLRICEDRSIEEYGNLKNIAEGKKVYAKLYDYFQKADQKYNSGLFDFKKDQLSEALKVEDEVLQGIIEEMYYPKSSFEFSVIPVEILGQAYEQFLGKVIRLTESHNVKIDEKPEVRKAGGVYYTEQYIADNIVKNTVGKLIEGMTPEQVSKIKICDPACGSGSFLLSAYQYLLNWHLDWYLAHKDKIVSKKDSPLTPECRLTTAEKKRILVNNIYGVDIDSQAVEVTKLSLLLKALEGETNASINQQMSMFHERVLPSLENNIRCGNSLVSSDFYDGQSMDLFGNQEMKKVNVFDWAKEFPDVFQTGGFDVVIGNPPYIRIQTLNEYASEQVAYFNKKYKDYVLGSYDIYILFIQRGYDLIKTNGHLGFILPHKFFQAEMGQKIRQWISKNESLNAIIDFSTNQIFENATTYTCLLFLTKQNNQKYFLYKKFFFGG